MAFPFLAAVAVAAVWSVVISTAAGAADNSDGVATYDCGVTEACFPWNSGGPSCSRKGRINLRFQLQVAPENARAVDGIRIPVDNVTYAYCPRVDEVMSVNISKAGQIAIVTNVSGASGNDETNATDWKFGSRKQVYLSAVGFGEQTNVNVPQSTSQGRVLIADLKDDVVCPVSGTVAIVPFVTLNVSMKKGEFEYFADYPQPAGVGFMPSCDKNEKCQLDSSMACIGAKTRKNCARCVTAESAATLNIQVWVSYFGTDSNGRHLLSGSNSPLNFVKFSGSEVGSSVSKAFDDVKSGNVIQNGDLQP